MSLLQDLEIRFLKKSLKHRVFRVLQEPQIIIF